MPKDAHNKAAELHENAAKSHRAAAEQHGKSDHVKGRNILPTLSSILRMPANRASKLTLKVSNRSNASVRTKNPQSGPGVFLFGLGVLIRPHRIGAPN